MTGKTDSESLIRAGLIVFIAYGLFNAANFFYHLICARALGPAEYSIVASLFSVFYLISVGSAAIQNTATKFIADFNAKNEDKKIVYFFRRGFRKIFLVSAAVFIFYLIISPLIAGFLKISLIDVLISSPAIILFALIPLNRGLLQGLQEFKSLGINLIIEAVARLVLAVLLISLGLHAKGAIAAVSIACAFALILTFPAIKIKKSKIAKNSGAMNKNEIYKFALISFIALFLINAVYTLDVFLVKHFFAAEQAGYYSALSLLGKIVFFGATSVGMVMFPKVSELKALKKDSKAIFRKALLYTLIISALITAVYFLFSKLIVSIVFGSAYLQISGLLGLFSIFMVLFSLSYICILHKLAIGKKNFIWNILAAVILEILLISLFHSSLMQIVIILIILNSLLFLSLLKK